MSSVSGLEMSSDFCECDGSGVDVVVEDTAV